MLSDFLPNDLILRFLLVGGLFFSMILLNLYLKAKGGSNS